MRRKQVGLLLGALVCAGIMGFAGGCNGGSSELEAHQDYALVQDVACKEEYAAEKEDPVVEGAEEEKQEEQMEEPVKKETSSERGSKRESVSVMEKQVTPTPTPIPEPTEEPEKEEAQDENRGCIGDEGLVW